MTDREECAVGPGRPPDMFQRLADAGSLSMRPRADKAEGEAAVLAKISAMAPGYAKDGKTVCFFRADKNYMTLGFTQDANLTREASAWYFTAKDDATEARLSAIVHKFAS